MFALLILFIASRAVMQLIRIPRYIQRVTTGTVVTRLGGEVRVSNALVAQWAAE